MAAQWTSREGLSAPTTRYPWFEHRLSDTLSGKQKQQSSFFNTLWRRSDQKKRTKIVAHHSQNQERRHFHGEILHSNQFPMKWERRLYPTIEWIREENYSLNFFLCSDNKFAPRVPWLFLSFSLRDWRVFFEIDLADTSVCPRLKRYRSNERVFPV